MTHSVEANVRGIRKLIADGVPGKHHDALVKLYEEVRPIWFGLIARARQAKAQREAKKQGKNVRKPVGRPLSTEILAEFTKLTAKYKFAGFQDGRALVDFLKEFPPSKNAVSHEVGIQRQIERRDAGFGFEAAQAKKMRASNKYIWVGRSAGSYGAVDIIAISTRGVVLAQCKATNAERSNPVEHKKLSLLYSKLGHIAQIRLYYIKDGDPVYVVINNETLPKLIGEDAKWNVVKASLATVERSPAEMSTMLDALSRTLHWRGSKKQLSDLYKSLAAFMIKSITEDTFVWTPEKRVEFRKLLDPYRGFLASQDAHVTKALLHPKFAPVVFIKDAENVRDVALESKIFKQAGFSLRVEKEAGVKTPIHVVRSTVAGDRIIVYHCRRNGHFQADEIEYLWNAVIDKLPRQVEFRVAWYANKRLIKTKTIKTRADLEWFSKQRGI
jgi:hypothetical protein